MAQKVYLHVSYKDNKANKGRGGMWRALGYYMERGSVLDNRFDEQNQGTDIYKTLDRWQAAGDPRFWSLIIDPYSSQPVDLKRLSRDFMRAIQKDVGAEIEWVAVIHTDTKRPHLHLAFRGVDRNGKEVRFPKPYIPLGMTIHAENLITNQAGYRPSNYVPPPPNVNLSLRQRMFYGRSRNIPGIGSSRTTALPPQGSRRRSR